MADLRLRSHHQILDVQVTNLVVLVPRLRSEIQKVDKLIDMGNDDRRDDKKK